MEVALADKRKCRFSVFKIIKAIFFEMAFVLPEYRPLKNYQLNIHY
jgi:hypothetical protein